MYAFIHVFTLLALLDNTTKQLSESENIRKELRQSLNESEIHRHELITQLQVRFYHPIYNTNSNYKVTIYI